MGVQERIEREREQMQRTILDAARRLFISQGYANVSLRKIADQIEYSPAAIYGYFKNKDEIFFALAEEGFRLLEGKVRKVLERGGDRPIDRVRRVLWGYYEFSRAQPEYFALMFLDRSVPRISRDWPRFAFVRDLKARAARLIGECHQAGELATNLPPDTAFHVLACGVHGAAVSCLCDRVPPEMDPDELARDVLDVMLAGMRASAPPRPATKMTKTTKSTRRNE